MARVYLSLGSNLGDRKANCQRALAELERRHVGVLRTISPFYMTEPVDYTDQDWFVNGAAALDTELSPRELLRSLQEIQGDLGTREKALRFGPRIIDLDILLYDDLVLNEGDLVLPHERMHQRAFVLVPLCDIAGEVRHPLLGKTMTELLSAIDHEHQDVKPLA